MNQNRDRQKICRGIEKLSLVVVLGALLAACAGNPPLVRTAVDVDIKIALAKETVDGVDILCPGKVNQRQPDVWRNKDVNWQTYTDASYTTAANYKYDIYFDPVVGSENKSSATGKAKIRIDVKAPEVVYKYTIWDRDKKCTPLDPNFRVSN